MKKVIKKKKVPTKIVNKSRFVFVNQDKLLDIKEKINECLYKEGLTVYETQIVLEDLLNEIKSDLYK